MDPLIIALIVAVFTLIVLLLSSFFFYRTCDSTLVYEYEYVYYNF